MPTSTCANTAFHSTRSPLAISPTTAANLLSLDSVFYQPTRWKSWYVKKLTCDLSIERHRASRERSKQQARVYSSYRNESHSNTTTTTPTTKQSPSIMIKARHQFSTIRTVYSDVRKSYVSEVNPLRAMLVQVDFEVFGDVSGVFFTKYAKSMCDNLNIKGWIRVSPKGTVYGQIQGEKEKVDEMALWLRLQGSPNSKIDYCTFKNWQIIDSCDFRNFNIRY